MTPEYENAQIASLVQALLGSISDNMRAISLKCVGRSTVTLTFVLEREQLADREAIADVVSEFDSLQGEGVVTDSSVIIDDGPLDRALPPGRLIYLRKDASAPTYRTADGG